MGLLERDALLGRLSILAGAARHGHGGLALIVGEAGIGKTSVAGAFCDTAPRTTRVLWGACDPVVPPRPFAPVVDIADQVGGELRTALRTHDRDGVLRAFLALIGRPDAPATVAVLDDLHWADEATLDLLRVVGRRLSRTHTLLIGTYRDHEVGRDHPLRIALGDIPPTVVTTLSLPPLSMTAVERMAGGRSDAALIHRMTGGNSFFVTEMLAAPPAAPSSPVPDSVRDAVLTRVSRLAPASRRVADAAAVLGPASAIRIVLELAGTERHALDACVAAALLQIDDGAVSFRHELARRAVADAMPRDETARLNRDALRLLSRPPAVDWPRLARHAVAAGDPALIVELTIPAAREAAAFGAHREAATFYRAAVEHLDRLAPGDRGDMLERFAHEALVTGDVPDALAAQEQALTTWRSLGDRVREGRCLVDLAGLLWFAGRGDLALATARAAAEQLAVAAPDSAELARALGVLAQRLAVAGADDQSAEEVASRALELAERLGAEPIAVHALTTIGIARIFEGDDRGWALLEQAAARARAADLPEETLRALINLVEAALDLRRYDLAEGYLAQADAYLEAHDLGLYDDILRSRIAALELEAGRWDRALADAEALLARRSTANPVRVRALTVRGLIHLRRGMVGGWTDLDAALVLDAGEIQELLPLRAARAEAAWLGDDLARGQEEATLGIGVGDRLLSPWWWSELAFWAWRCGASGPSPHPDERPYWLHAEGRPSEAAAMWASLGAPYREASALADTGREPALRRALETFNALGARVMARRTTIALQALGATRIARGPSATTRTNAALLTARQRDVLVCLGEGLPNAAIARRLVISPKTVDHHVSAILRKLDVHDRDAAVAAARRLGLPVAGSRDGEAGTAT